MRFQAEHRFNGPPDEVVVFLTDPQFYATLSLPDLSQPEVLESSNNAGRSLLRLRYEFVGSLDPMARRLLGQSRLRWIQQVVVEDADGSGELTFNAEADPRRLYGTADFSFRPADEGCIRRLEGELVVAVPLIGSRAERKIVPGVLRRLDIEAEAVNRALAAGSR